ncbi:hypothetical protein VSDG_05018 [Cytospora chrysosperma]|uniref:Uncharacterized protein n=1 Tax=Cytospora chrysosperma TaxID=252740 RepID=A0A423VYK7_CYTCH|nr:hypothetical protein VSDG_05018 [Valsa sordida]
MLAKCVGNEADAEWQVQLRLRSTGTDNRYKLTEQTYADELFQCSVRISRPDNETFNWVVPDGSNNDLRSGSDTVNNNNGSFTAPGLPRDLKVSNTGAQGTMLSLVYAVSGTDPDFLTWDSDDVGDGRGPLTDARSPFNYCSQTTESNGEWQKECWFGYYNS